ncbi:hypothetical protein NQ317_007259 [Molorchus minor]|uniref:Uncharacterized protein n=1 Tax=Molorchus minor TaxID=1323400 RepID=A0ABQ9JZI9_9CUCU|nr:hypothetical protein NQ317_007259 [Molorchus minor]
MGWRRWWIQGEEITMAHDNRGLAVAVVAADSPMGTEIEDLIKFHLSGYNSR